MRKFSFFAICLLVLAVSVNCYAADTSHAAAVSGDVNQVVAIGDASSGYLAEVSSNSGSLNIASRAYNVTSQVGDGQLYTGSCRLQGLVVTGALATDYALIYDATSATGTAKFDVKLDAANKTVAVPCFGAPIETGIYIDDANQNVHVTAVWDN